MVFIGYASDRGYGLVNYQLFMPEKWFSKEYESLRKKCCVPDDVTFKTKPEMAGEMLKEAFNSGLVKAKWIGCDSLFGASKTFLDSLPQECRYFADIHRPTLVWRDRPEVALPEYSGRGPFLECLTPPHNVRADRPSFYIGNAPAFKKNGRTGLDATSGPKTDHRGLIRQ